MLTNKNEGDIIPFADALLEGAEHWTLTTEQQDNLEISKRFHHPLKGMSHENGKLNGSIKMLRPKKDSKNGLKNLLLVSQQVVLPRAN